MFACSCKGMKNYIVQFVLEALYQACGLGDARAVSCVLQQNWRVETGVYEAGVRALFTMMSAAIPNVGHSVEPAPDGSIFYGALARNNIAMELDCSAEEECLRISVWERGAFSVIASMQVFSIPLPDFLTPLFMALWLCDCC